MVAVPTLEDVERAEATLAGQVLRTPLVPAPKLSARFGCQAWLKLENLQHTGSFKERGALVKLHSLSREQAAAGVVAMSAGNHAQGLAYHGGRLGIAVTIVMPLGASFTKVEGTETLGARVLLKGDTFDAASAFARKLAEQQGLTFIHPYDDPAIVAGQGTIGLEMVRDAPDLDAIIVPVGGGGLIAGIASAVKAIAPRVRIVGVQSQLYPSMHHHLHHLRPAAGGATLAEGIAVKHPGRLTRAIIRRLVEEILLVDEESLESAVYLLSEWQHVVAEGAGAAGIAALIRHGDRFAGQKVGVVVSGGNIDMRLLGSVLMRGLMRDGHMVRLRIDISDQPGVLGKVAGLVGHSGGNIVEVYHQRLFADVPVKRAEVDLVLETRNPRHIEQIVGTLEAGGFPTRILSPLSTEQPRRSPDDE